MDNIRRSLRNAEVEQQLLGGFSRTPVQAVYMAWRFSAAASIVDETTTLSKGRGGEHGTMLPPLGCGWPLLSC